MDFSTSVTMAMHYGSVLLCVFAITGFTAEGADPIKLNHPLRAEGLTVIESGSPQFMTEVAKLLPPDAIAKASSFLPRSFVIVNNTHRYIWSFTLIYTYPDWVSPAGTAWQHQISPTADGFDQARMFGPGAMYLVTPVSDFLASLSASGRVERRPFLDEGMDRMINLFRAEYASRRIEASIDSIIFEDGTLVGPDSAKRIDRVGSRISRLKDFLASLEKLRGDDLRKALRIYSEPGAGPSDEASRYVADYAAALLLTLDNRGEAVE
jgi:hypothetical protein